MLNIKQISVLLLIFGVVFGVLSTVFYNDGSKEIDEILTKTKGELEIPNTSQNDVPEEYRIIVASTDFPISREWLEKGLDFRNIVNLKNANYVLKMTFNDNNKLIITADIKNELNQTIAYITNNKWGSGSLDSPEIEDRNYNAYALEIISKQGIPILQVVMMDNNTIAIGLCANDGNNFWLFAPINGAISSIPNPTQRDFYEISKQRIFQYPSSEHLGKMVDPQAYPIPDIANEGMYIQSSSSPSIPNYPTDNPIDEARFKQSLGVYIFAPLSVIFLGLMGIITIKNKKRN